MSGADDHPARHLAAPTSLALDAATVHRITRLLTRDHFPPIHTARQALVHRLGDSPWALLPTCPWCVGQWVALAVTAGHAGVVARWGSRGHRAWTLAILPWALSSVAGLLSDHEGG